MAANTTDSRDNFVRLVTSECSKILTHSSVECTVAYWIETVRPYLIIVLGTLGNLLTIFTCLRKRLRKLSTSVYLMFLAGSDLLSGNTWTTELQHQSDFHCKGLWYVVTVTGIYSSWVLVLVSFERMIFVTYPIFARTRITWKTALISCLIALACIGILSSHYLIGNEVITHPLTPSSNTTQSISKICFASSATYQQFRAHSWPTILMLVSVIVPATLIAINSVITINGLRRKSRQIASVGPSGNMSLDSRRDRRDAAVSRMMMFVSAYFISTTLPFCIYQTYISTMPPLTNQKEFQTHVLIITILFVLITSNYVLNCVFYFCCGTQFRREWKEIMDGLKRKMSTIYAGKNVIHVVEQATQQRSSTSSKT